MHKIFRKGSKLFLAIPSNLNIYDLIKVIKFIPSFTLKRKLYKIYVFLTMLFSKTITKNNNLTEINNLINRSPILSDFDYIVVWSLVSGRKRCYIYFYDNNINLVYFGKLTQNINDLDLLRNEYTFLLNYNVKKTDNHFKTPSVIYFDELTTHSFLVVDSLPNDFKLFHPQNNNLPERVYDDLNTNKVKYSLSYCFTKDWWLIFIEVKYKTPGLYNYIINQPADSEIILSFIHGDFGSENIFKNKKDQFYIIDWERSSKTGPYLADRIAFWLGKHHNKITNKKAFNQFFIQENKLKISLALCYLVSVNFDLAITISKEIFDD
tara:strand:- start:1949 stop:2914 length:966 start_codon:yes stop_codon:yes gene_type:complete